MTLPLKKCITIAIWTTCITLAVLLLLALRQVQLARNQAELADQAEKTVFQFTIIREHLQEILLARQHERLGGVASELEEVNGSLSRLLGSKEVAEEYRLAMLNGMDLAGAVLLLRKLGEGPVTDEGVRQFNGEMRAMGEKLLRFDRLLVSSAKMRLLRYQNVVIGLLALLLSLLVAMLLWLRRRMAAPLERLNAGVERVVAEGGTIAELPGSVLDIRNLARIVRDLLQRRQALEGEIEACNQLAATVKRANMAMGGANDRPQLFREVCRALLHNPQYCLVWIGEPDESGGVQPAAADGSTTMSRKECESCMAVLLTEAEEGGKEHNPALQAMLHGKPVVKRDILAGIPKGLLKGTELANRNADCAALPVQWQGRMHGVITIYALVDEGFSARELEMLEGLATTLGLAVSVLEMRRQLRTSGELLPHVCDRLQIGVLGIGADGRIITANEVAKRLALGKGEAPVGRSLQDLARLPGGGRGELVDGALLEAVSAGVQGVNLLFAGGGGERPLWCQVFAASDMGGDRPVYWCLLAEPGQRPGLGAMDEGRRSARMALLGEVAVGVAHEISDLSNGLINYAQVLADEAAEESQASGLLGNIIGAGEHIAAMVGKLHYYGEPGEPAEYLPLLTVLDDAVTLCQYHMKKAGIQVSISIDDDLPELPVNARQVQQVLLEIFSHARRALNLRYPGRHENKRFLVDAKMAGGPDAEMVLLAFTDHGAAALNGLSGREGGDGAELDRCRQLAAALGARMSITGVNGEHTTVSLDFPVN